MLPAPATAEVRPAGEGALIVEGPLHANPANGALFRGLRPLRLPPEHADAPAAAAMAPHARADLVVQLFHSLSRAEAIAPICYDPEAGPEQLLAEVLPRTLMLDRLGAPPMLRATVGLALGVQDATQDALAAGLFGRRRLRAHAFDKVIAARAAWLLPPPGPDLMAEAAERIARVFSIQRKEGPPTIVLRGGPAALSARLAPAPSGLGAWRVVDPLTTPIAAFAEAVLCARILALPARGPENALARLRPDTSVKLEQVQGHGSDAHDASVTSA
ncbi:hypothetical protein [Oceanicella actignis]|uniref:Uncharacterized protein n=1 Tax=Oceanicella actignis TaxID=1189325 RepID=A0A1M7TJ68_9RHOB|nr:hypothetical protein [Oceanicella actignis]SET65551.1 hypothetical protein SAMN04488119_1072 [Oceanicella actignis]SHN70683.1 hypothetical protein SAMN05216200_1071 [Oceanicella actignis]